MSAINSERIIGVHPARQEKPKVLSIVPESDVRLTANIKQSLHMRLKIQAAKESISMGAIIERMIDENVPKEN